MTSGKEKNTVVKTIFSIAEAAEFVGLAPNTIYQHWKVGKVPALDGTKRPLQFVRSDLIKLRASKRPGFLDRFLRFQDYTRLPNNVLAVALGMTDPSLIAHWRSDTRNPSGYMMQKANQLLSGSIERALYKILRIVQRAAVVPHQHGDKESMVRKVNDAISRNHQICFGSEPKLEPKKLKPKYKFVEPVPAVKLVVAPVKSKHIPNVLPREMCENIERWMRIHGASFSLTARLIGCSSSAFIRWLGQGSISMPMLEKVEKFCRDRSIEMTGHLVTSRLTFMPEKKVEPEDDGRKEIELDDNEFDDEGDDDEEEDEEEEKETFDETLERLVTEFSKARVAMKHAKEAIKRHVA